MHFFIIVFILQLTLLTFIVRGGTRTMADRNILKISEWLDGQKIFITGVSGFIGKVLLWKLLKSCPKIQTVYVLIRPKKGKTTEERLDQLLNVEIFDEFKQGNPDLLKKVVGVEGDICQSRLGLQDSDWRLLQGNVTLVFHVAASVRFDDTLQKAIFTNLRSTKYALLLAKEMKNLKAFVHVSTAYTNCRFPHIPEKVIPTEFDPEKMIAIAEKTDEHKLEVLSQNFLKGYPNTYVFTKNLAEDLVYKSRYEIPVVIIRPPIVGSAVKDPEPGWNDSMSGISALMVGTGKGVIRVMYGNPENDMDLISVDGCANAAIIAAWQRDMNAQKSSDKTLVFNLIDYKLKLGEDLRDKFTEIHYSYPLTSPLWIPITVYTRNSFYFHILTFLLHILPGLLLDGALKVSGQKPRLMKIYRKMYAVSTNLKPFMSNVYSFDTSNFKMLEDIVPEEEKELFFTDTFKQISKEKHFINVLYGGRKLVGDPPKITKRDLKYIQRLYWADRMLRLILIRLFIYILPLKSVFDWSLYMINEIERSFIEISEDY